MSLLHETLTHKDIDDLWKLRQQHPWASTRELRRKLMLAQEEARKNVRHDG